MDYILKGIEKKIIRFEGTSDAKIYHQVRVEYAFNLLLAYFWNKNFEEIGITDFVTQSNIIKEIQRPSIGTVASLVQKLDMHNEISSEKANEVGLSAYAELRNDLIGHGYSFEDDLTNYSNSFDNWYKILLDLNIPILTRKTNIIVCERFSELTQDYAGTIYDSNGEISSNWKCPKEVFEFEIGNVYGSYELNSYFRLSPFIHIEPTSDDAVYIYRNVQQALLGKIRYNRLDKSEKDFTKCWEEFEFVANNGTVKKQPNGSVINIFSPNYRRYIEVGTIKEKIYSFLTGKEKGSSVCVTLWGHGGNGKTATAQKICDELSLNDKRPFEFIIFLSAKDRELNKYSGRISSISSENRITNYDELIESINNILYSEGSCDIERFVNEKSKTLLVIDDYETFEDVDKERITHFIKQLNLNYHKVIITTRNSFLKIGDEIQTNELSVEETIRFLIEILKNDHDFKPLSIESLEEKLKSREIKSEIHKITLGKPLEIIRFVNCFIQKGNLSDDFLNEMKRANARSERTEFLYGRNYSQLSGDRIAQNIFVVIGLLTPVETFTSLVSHLKLILGIRDTEDVSFNNALDKLVKLRLIELDDDGSYRVDSKDILNIMKSEYEKRDPNFKSGTKAIYDRIKSNISNDTDRAVLNHVKSLRHQSNAETTIQQYKEIIKQGKDFSYNIKLEALLDLGDFLFNQRGEKELAVKLFDDYFDKFYDFVVLKRYASYSWSVNKEKAIKILEDFYSQHTSHKISLTKSQKSHLLGLIVMREGQFWNDKFEKDFKKREKIKEDLGRISKAFGHLLLTQLKNSSLPDDFTSEELNDISLALETYVDVCYRIYNKKLALEICELALEKFPERFNSRFKRKKEKIVGYRSYYTQTKPLSEPARESRISELGVKLKDALNQFEIINLEIAENGYKGEILRIYDDKTQYGYIKLQSDDIKGRIYFRASSLVNKSFISLKVGDKVEFGFGKITAIKFGAINIKTV
jgi:hypothetical protein